MSRTISALLLVALVQSIVICWLLVPKNPAFMVKPYYRSGPREAWQSFDVVARAYMERCKEKSAGVWVRRGLEAQDELYALRNRTHALNVQVCNLAAEIVAQRGTVASGGKSSR